MEIIMSQNIRGLPQGWVRGFKRKTPLKINSRTKNVKNTVKNNQLSVRVSRHKTEGYNDLR